MFQNRPKFQSCRDRRDYRQFRLHSATPLINHEELYKLNIVLSFTHILSQSLPFLQLQVCDL